MSKNKPQQTPKSRNDFIKFFQSIPSNKWTTCGNYDSPDGRRSCAIGHARKAFGFNTSVETTLCSFFRDGKGVVDVNDKRTPAFPQRTAKGRVIAFLKALPA